MILIVAETPREAYAFAHRELNRGSGQVETLETLERLDPFSPLEIHYLPSGHARRDIHVVADLVRDANDQRVTVTHVSHDDWAWTDQRIDIKPVEVKTFTEAQVVEMTNFAADTIHALKVRIERLQRACARYRAEAEENLYTDPDASGEPFSFGVELPEHLAKIAENLDAEESALEQAAEQQEVTQHEVKSWGSDEVVASRSDDPGPVLAGENDHGVPPDLDLNNEAEVKAWLEDEVVSSDQLQDERSMADMTRDELKQLAGVHGIRVTSQKDDTLRKQIAQARALNESAPF